MRLYSELHDDMPRYLDDRYNLVGARLLTKCRLGYVTCSCGVWAVVLGDLAMFPASCDAEDVVKAAWALAKTRRRRVSYWRAGVAELTLWATCADDGHF